MVENLFTHYPDAALNAEAETFEPLLSGAEIIIERIISTGQATPPGVWYCQTKSEWVVVLRGSAGLQFEDESAIRVLQVGDFVNIPANRRHRVDWTDNEQPTIWLAVHYPPPGEAKVAVQPT